MFDQNQILFGLLVAAIFGGLIGFERERSEKPAGIRTQALVCAASALVTMVSVDFFAGSNIDSVARILQGILTGVGFIGAGSIMKNIDHIEGLTTAATVWVVAAVGIVIGLGYYLYALYGVIFFMLILISGKIERKLHNHH